MLTSHLQWGIALFSLLSTVVSSDPVRPYPLVDSRLTGTNFLNHSSYIESFDDQQWYLDNIPFVDFPDQSMQDVYYYRTSVIKRHLRWAHEGHGWVVTEFIHPVAWDSAAYHVLETRWLRDPNYAKNLIEEYTRGGVEKLSFITYTHYMHRAILEHAQATGDVDFLTSQLQGMIESYYLWNTTRDNATGLYHRTPLSDAQEYSLPGYLTGGPGGGPMQEWDDFGLAFGEGGGNDYLTIWLGPETYRPNFNAYMIAGARAISEVATLVGDGATSTVFSNYADDLYTKMESFLWSDELQFWIDVVEGTNLRCLGRELIGYFPYRFDVGTNETFVRALEAGLTPERFLTEFGPTTLEQTNPYFTALKNTTYCCMWQGQSWPFSTAIYLGTLARMARENVSSVVTPAFFNQELNKYVRTNYKDGVPYTAESHYPTIDAWSGDTTNHSENYLHSSYLDNIFTNLLGIIPTLDDRLEMRPLVPENWTHFAVENLPYHGSLLSIVWDSTGSYYSNSSSSGLRIYSNGSLIHTSSTLSPFNCSLPFSSQSAASALAAQPEYQNIVANPNSPWGLPNVSADYTFSTNGDYSPYEAWKMNDGLLWYDTTPDNRWTNNQSTTPYNTITVTLPRARNISSVSLAIFDDTRREGEGEAIACPAGVRITTRSGAVVAERRNWTECVPNALNTIAFTSPVPAGSFDNSTTPASGTVVLTDQLKITLNTRLGYAVAVSEVQIWVPPTTGPRWEVEDGVIGTFIGSFEGRKTGFNGTITNGGVQLGDGGWVELAGVRTTSGQGGAANLTLIGAGHGTLEVGVNWLTNHTVTFAGNGSKTVEVDLLRGSNVITLFQTEGRPWIDAVVVG